MGFVSLYGVIIFSWELRKVVCGLSGMACILIVLLFSFLFGDVC